MFIVIYFHAVILTQAATDHISDLTNPHLAKHWGSLAQSMLTLFYCVSGGLDWHIALDPLIKIHGIYGLVFIVYILIMSFSIVNAITGAFCQAAADSTVQDRDLHLQDLLSQKRNHLNQMSALFEKTFLILDSDQSGEINMSEFNAQIQDESIQALLEMLDLEPEDAWALFRLLDKDGSGDLNLKEFVKGCMQLKGNARSIDVAKTIYDQKVARKQNKLFMQYVTEQFNGIKATLETINGFSLGVDALDVRIAHPVKTPLRKWSE